LNAPSGSVELLRFSTAGSVDDGKSTLIGRLLHDTGCVYEDQWAGVMAAAKRRNEAGLEFAYLTDGLRAEREQGITIDVAYRHFSTPRRRFILADTPGHEQYTRNMATGASTADLAVILVDAANGFVTQSRRHTYIAHLLGTPLVVLAVNKMDLVDYRQEVFDAVQAQFNEFAARLGLGDVLAIPVSALVGDNVARPSDRMPWYTGPSLLEYLETVPLPAVEASGPARFPVQYVIWAPPSFRGYAGQVASGVLHVGDSVVALPSGRHSRVASISTIDGERTQAAPRTAIAVRLEDEIDIGRGDMIAGVEQLPTISRHIRATVVWMDQRPLEPGRAYLIKHTTQQVYATVDRVLHKVHIDTLAPQPADRLTLNEIGAVAIETYRPLFADPYRHNRATGAFILIDPASNATVAAGMIADGVDVPRVAAPEPAIEEQAAQFTLWLTGRRDVAVALQALLESRGIRVDVLGDEAARFLPELIQVLRDAGRSLIATAETATPEAKIRARALTGEERFLDLDEMTLDADPAVASAFVMQLLGEKGWVPAAVRPSARQRGVAVWFTGLSGAGKTTISRAVENYLRVSGYRVEVLDGDELRHTLGKGLHFSKEDRDENIRRIGYVASLLTRNGVIVLVSVISPYREIRDKVRDEIRHFAEVYVNTPLEVCEQRDVKGLYRKARAGLIHQFTGIDDPYEVPLNPEIECRTAEENVEVCAARVLAWLRANGYIA
jgi:adenylyl-sulfate kinase